MTAAEAGVEIELIEGDQRRVQEAVMAGEADVALLYDLGLPEELEVTLLSELAPYVLLAQDHPLAQKPELEAQDLEGHPMIQMGGDADGGTILARCWSVPGVRPRVAYRSTSFEMVRGLVGQGLGFAILATRPAATVSYDGHLLVTRPLKAQLRRAG